MIKTALVTGASRGIGFEIARQLSEKGYHIIAASSSYNENTEKKFADSFKNGFTYVYGDIKAAETREFFLAKIKELGRIDLLVNNAGIAPPVRMDILETTEESFDLVMETNLKATFFLTQAVANYMVDSLGKLPEYEPRIVNIGSMSAYVSSTSRGEYCISKAGISMVTALFADRLSEFNIPVFEIRPGIIKTDMTSAVTAKYDKLIFTDGITPTKRWGEPSDIAKIVSSISDGNFDFSTGQVFNADGGFHLRRL